jgi:hypothetical protein
LLTLATRLQQWCRARPFSYSSTTIGRRSPYYQISSRVTILIILVDTNTDYRHHLARSASSYRLDVPTLWRSVPPCRLLALPLRRVELESYLDHVICVIMLVSCTIPYIIDGGLVYSTLQDRISRPAFIAEARLTAYVHIIQDSAFSPPLQKNFPLLYDAFEAQPKELSFCFLPSNAFEARHQKNFPLEFIHFRRKKNLTLLRVHLAKELSHLQCVCLCFLCM